MLQGTALRAPGVGPRGGAAGSPLRTSNRQPSGLYGLNHWTTVRRLANSRKNFLSWATPSSALEPGTRPPRRHQRCHQLVVSSS